MGQFLGSIPRGRRVSERITEYKEDYPEIFRKYFYDNFGRLEKQIDSQQGTVLYLDGENSQRITKFLQ